jgi:hypothetical protein
MKKRVGIGRRLPRETGASRDPFLGTRATVPDEAAYRRWCLTRGVMPQPQEPLAYGDVPALTETEFAQLKTVAAARGDVDGTEHH